MNFTNFWLGVTGTVALSVGLSGAASAQDRVLKVTNWAEYIAEDTIANFEAEYGIKVIYDNYDSVEAIDAKLLAGNSGYDVVSHAASQTARLIAAGGIVQPLDKSKLDNFKHMDEAVLGQLSAKWDPDNAYIVPFMWGTHGVTYNEALVLETYPDAPIGSLDLIFDPKHMKEIAKCGVSFLDSPTDMIPMALAYLGLPPDSTNAEDYNKVAALLAEIRPYIKTFDNYAYQRMPQKEFCVSTTWGPDGLLAMSGAAEANTGVVLDFFLPEGDGASNFWVDGWAIPADAENVEDAHLFLNYMMRPEVGAADSNYTWYATANATGKAMVDEEVTSSPAAFPTPDQVAQMYTLSPLPPRAERVRTRTWTNFKAGN
ncbi:Putrescine ABC transporter putrescine-binding protein PotF [Candidatus Rhodobacter oscarellae]|uniref:Putrescine-binding periplasmic protein n=1 Tax=Candidatus Rhodobacter oscarellae TaxID=1675527 RepID=A0A0J9H3J2_9RHOB|nr:extracellular solute-binding protein [Candidatus Rhodobacter lobularis]KMW60228.1 Putrescine ABC transporter putrescine-binding protein PotF [Candidatus Rhodobacter lobularis]